MHSLITFATQWGSKLGGINSFNTDFLEAFGAAYYNSIQVICIVAEATDAEIKKASNSHVILLPLPYTPLEKTFSKDQARAGIDLLKQHGISFEAERTIWLGHDRITGAAAVEAANIAGGRSALIHHMSYDHYESFSEDSRTAYHKNQEQQKLFKQANLVFAIGPLLCDAAHDLVGGAKAVHMLIPGLAEIEVRSAPKTFTAFLSGRLSTDAARIKQSHLGLAAFSHAHKMACENNMPDGLLKQPKLMLRGVDYAGEVKATHLQDNPEIELKAFAEEYAGRAINLQALPYTHDRDELYDNISRSSVALMPSWHEGFGLVAWEAIAAGVPLIISKHSGVYNLLEDKFPGIGTGCVYSVDVRGSNSAPFFKLEDLHSIAEALKKIAHAPDKARQQAGTLRGLLINDYTWSNCVVQAANAFGWIIQKGSLLPAEQRPITAASIAIEPQLISNDFLVQMPVKHWHAGTFIADSQLLRAEEALVPFEVARQPEVDKLDIWLDDPQYPHAVRLLTGAGGLGKTRLALHLCEQRILAGWHAGFLASEFDPKSLITAWQSLRTLKQPLFIVVDYAETRQDDLLALIKTMLQTPTDLPVRLLLLARDGGEWWDNLPAKNQICESLLSSYATSGPYRLPPLHNGIQDRQQAYRQALHAFAEALGAPFPDVIPELAGEHFGRPLYLQMAALLALRGERPTTAQGLTRALLNHERRYWRGLFSGHVLAEPERYAEQLLALITLAGGFATPKAVLPHWKRVNNTVLSSAQVAELFCALIPLYPGKQGLEAVRPDLLGEALVAQALLRSSAADLLDAVLGKDADKSMRSNVLTVLARLSDNYQELHETLIEGLTRNFAHCWQEFILVAVETPSNLPTFAEIAFGRLPSNTRNQIMGLLKERINVESVQLAQFYCFVSKFLVEKCSQQFNKKANDVEIIEAYYGALLNYSNHLVNAGRYEEGLEPARQALELIGRLARKNPDRFDPDYAISLSNYANHLGDAGRNEEALDYARQALNIRERLVQKNLDRFEYDHTKSLSNYAHRLSHAGRNEEALDHARRALKIDKRLAQNNPIRFDSNYARSLSNYSSYLNDLGRNEEALEPALQALELRERLAQTNRDRFEPDYATSLRIYAIRLGDAGRNKEALEHAHQALNIHERLAQTSLDRFEPDYATSLSNYANLLSDTGRDEEAREYGRQALEIFQRLVQKAPISFQADWFAAVCDAHFHEWMADDTYDSIGLAELQIPPESAPPHRRPALKLYASFVQACRASDQTGRMDAFKEVTSIWGDFSKSNKILTQSYWMCAAAWRDTHERSREDKTNWKVEWHQFAKQRQGHVPCWMLEVARRLKFEWPK